ncbi:MAG: glycoside hydrolase family 97 catalytic domain-containing protein [Prevotellaceae bacterium]|nr:glycoside hydrolase family 97 catalytic domain-containing protein [Prevotellaceae bacterium]
MKHLFYILSLACTMCVTSSYASERICSPDGRLVFEYSDMTYSIKFIDKTIIEQSSLGVEIHNKLFENALAVKNDQAEHWCDNLRIESIDRDSLDETWMPPYGEWKSIRNKYNRMVIHFIKGERVTPKEGEYLRNECYLMDLEVRAYNEGIAFRYTFPEAINGLFIHLTNELTEFRFADGAEALCCSWAQGPYTWMPLKDWKEEAERPLTLRLQNGIAVSLLEARLVDYARTKFCLKQENVVKTQPYSSVDFMTPYSTSWRLVMVGEKFIDLCNHDYMVLNLNEKQALHDTSWIRPGKVFRSNLDKKSIMESIDFATDRHFQYVHLDAGWYGTEWKMESSALQVAPTRDFTIPEIVEYAKSKGIGVFLYVNQRALYQQLDSIVPLYKEWGVKGIKFGFVQVGNQQWTTWLHKAIRLCAEHHLMVDIHDEYRPTGYSRTYPNLMTAEGIRGNEEMPDATHNVTLPFTRFLCGPADYTLCYFNNRVKCTKAHQLAMAAVYYSPLTWMFWYDKPSLYRGEKEIEFWEKIPTTFDDTKVLQGKPGEYIVTARRSGEAWFVGTMTNNDARTVTLPLDFLAKGKKYTAHIYEDKPELGTRTNVSITTKKVNSKKTLTLPLLPSGGAAIWFEQIN